MTQVYTELLNNQPLELLLEANLEDILKNEAHPRFFPAQPLLNTLRSWDAQVSSVTDLKNSIALLLAGMMK